MPFTALESIFVTSDQSQLRAINNNGSLGATIDPEDHTVEATRDWLIRSEVATLNIAGPRESKRPGIYLATRNLLDRIFP